MSSKLNKTEANKRFLSLRELPGNARCAECHAADTTWCVLDYGVLICMQCAGAHRGLGVHISQVRSTNLDTFTKEELEWIESQGNAKSATLYEGALPPTMRRPTGDCPDAVRRMWLRNKYDELNFTAGLDTNALAPHETLSGWVHLREPGLLARWKRRFACVRGGALLCWYGDEETEAEQLKGAVSLADAVLTIDPDDPLVLKLRSPTSATPSKARETHAFTLGTPRLPRTRQRAAPRTAPR